MSNRKDPPHLYWKALGIWQRYGALVVHEARVGSVDGVGSVRHVDPLVEGDVNVTGKNLRLRQGDYGDGESENEVHRVIQTGNAA